MGTGVEITLIGKPGCHLCEDARVALDAALVTFSQSNPTIDVNLTELNILEDAELAAKHSEEIPVVLIDGQMHSYWRVDEARLLAKLAEVTNA